MNIKVIGHGSLMGDSFYTSFLLDNILLSAPPGVLKKLKEYEINFDDIDIIVVPHLHGEEYFDLPMIIAHERARKRQKQLVIIGPKGLKNKVRKLIYLAFKEYYLDDLKISFIDASNIQNANLTKEIRFSFINMNHSDLKNAYGLILKQGNFSIGFSFGTRFCPGLSYMLKEVKNCVINVSKSDDENTLTIEEFKELVKEFPISYFPVGYPESILSDLEENRNSKIIKEGEQFYI